MSETYWVCFISPQSSPTRLSISHFVDNGYFFSVSHWELFWIKIICKMLQLKWAFWNLLFSSSTSKSSQITCTKSSNKWNVELHIIMNMKIIISTVEKHTENLRWKLIESVYWFGFNLIGFLCLNITFICRICSW